MLEFDLVHPQVLAALAAAGHGSTVLVCDGNYPAATATAPGAVRVHLGLAPGVLDAVTVVRALLTAVRPESAALMVPDDGPEPVAHPRLRAALPPGVPVTGQRRHDFYASARGPDLALAVVTADQRPYANVLLTLAGRRPPA